MSIINLSDQEWGQVMACLASAPWREANPLLMKIGEQLRLQHVTQESIAPNSKQNSGQEAHHGE